jgi:hypothetical protein
MVVNVYEMSATYAARIYRIICDLDDEEYIGSTKQTLSKRMAAHRSAAKKPVCVIHVRMSTVGVEHFKIVLIEELQVENNEQLRKREQEVIEERRATLNTIRAYIDEEGKKARKLENKEYTAQVHKAYALANIEKRHAHNKAYSLANRAAISERVRLRNAATGDARKYCITKRAIDKAAGKYKCETCATTYATNGALKLHKTTDKHMNVSGITIHNAADSIP